MKKKIRYNGQVYVRLDNELSEKIDNLKTGMEQLGSAWDRINSAHKFLSKANMSSQLLAEVLKARKMCSDALELAKKEQREIHKS